MVDTNKQSHWYRLLKLDDDASENTAKIKGTVVESFEDVSTDADWSSQSQV